MTRAERKAGEFLKRLERGKPKPYSKVENGSSEYSDVLKGEFLKRLERPPQNRPSKHYHADNVFAEVISENNIPIASAYRDKERTNLIPYWNEVQVKTINTIK